MAQPDGDPGVSPAEPGQQRGQIHHAQGLDRAHLQLAVQHTPHARYRVTAFVGGGEGPAGRGQQRAARLSQRHPAVVPDEERFAQFPFQRGDRRAQAGLRHVHPGRGPGEVPLLGHRDKVRQAGEAP